VNSKIKTRQTKRWASGQMLRVGIPAIAAVAALGALALAAAVSLPLLGTSGTSAHGTLGSFAERLVGDESRSPLLLQPKRGVEIGVADDAMVARNRGGRLAFGLRDAHVGDWMRHASGAVRRTSFGTEVVKFGLPAAEEFLVVNRHFGGHTFTWDLGDGVRPVVAGGSVTLVDGHGRPLNLQVSSPRILDLERRDITPADLTWSTEHSNGRWALQLDVDDNAFPKRYVIDPVVTFRASGTAQANAATSISLTLPASVASGDLVIVELSVNNTASTSFASSGTSTACSSGLTLFDSTSGAGVRQLLYWGIAGAADAGKTCVLSWTGGAEVTSIAAVYTTGTYYTTTPVDFVSPASITATASTTYTTNSLRTYFSSEFLAVAVTENDTKALGVPSPGTWVTEADQTNTSGATKIRSAYYDGATRATAGSSTVSGSVGNPGAGTVAAAFGIRQSDTTAPTTSLDTPAANAKIKNGQSLTATLTDEPGGSGAQEAAYYYCLGNVTCNSSTGSPTLIGQSTTGTTYSVAWNSQPADGTYTIFAKGSDNATNTADSSSIVVTIDNSAPTATITSPGTGQTYRAATLSSLSTISGTASDSGGSGLAAVSVSIQSANGNYWTGGAWQAASTWIAATGTGSWNAGVGTLTGDGDGTYTITSDATDGSGNTGTATRSFVYDSTAPTMSSVTSSTANGSYKAGASISIQVSFNDAVSVTGTPTLALNSSGSASYSSGSGSSTLTFTYTIAAGENAADLDYAATTSLALAGGTIKDAAANNAILTLPTVGGASSLGGQKNIVIDTTAPTNAFSLTGVTTVGGFPVAFYPGAGSTIFYNPAAGIGARAFTVRANVTDVTAGGASATTQSFSAGTSNMTHTNATTVTPGSGIFETNAFDYSSPTSGNASVDVYTTDAAGNPSATTSFAIQGDTTAPTAAVGFPSAGAYNGSGWTGSLTGTSSDAAVGVYAVKLSIRDVTAGGSSCWSGAGAFDQACPNFVAATGTTAWSYGLAAGTLTDGHTYSLTVETTDELGNTDSSAATRSFAWDTSAPTIMSASVGSDGVTATVTWSEPLDQTQAVAGSAFSITPNGGAAIPGTASAVSYPAPNQIRFTLATAVHIGDSLTLDYTQPGAGPRVRDTAVATGSAAATAGGASATNGTADLDPTTPALVSPANAAVLSTTTPTLGATFSDPDPNDSGTVAFEVCSDSGCSSSVTFQSGTVANGANGSAAVPGAFSLQNGTTYYWRARSVDSASAVSSFSATRSLRIDTTSPSIGVTAPTALTGTSFQYYDGGANTLWLNAGQTGTFKLNATASDAESGILSVDFPAIFGTGSNAGTGGPSYSSATYTFDGTGTPFGSPGSKTVTASNGVTVPGPLTATDQLTIAADNTAPAAFGLGGPADATKARGTSIVVSASPADGAGSGLRQVEFLECDRTATPLCVPSVAIGTPQTVPMLGVYSITVDTTGLTDGHEYALLAVATDNVGHTTSSSANTILVDNSAPTVTIGSPVAVTGGQYQWYDTASKKLWLNASQSGSFKLRANADDPHSGISSLMFPDVFGSGSNSGAALGGGVYESTTYSFSTPAAPGSQSISAANGVTLPSAGTSSDALTIAVDGAVPATIPTFPLNNGSYDNTTWNAGCTTSGICGTVIDGGSGVASVALSIKDSTTGKYFDGAGFTQASQIPFLIAGLAGTNWRYAIDDSKLTSPHLYVVEAFGTDHVGNADTHQQLRFTYGNDTGAPTTTLSLSGATNAFLQPLVNGIDYNLYYSTANGSGGFTLDASATDPSGVDTVTFPDLSTTTGFSGSGGLSTNGGNADPFAASRSYDFTIAAATAPAPKNVTSVDLRSNAGDNGVAFLLDNAAPTGGGLTVGGSIATGAGSSTYVTTTSISVDSRADYALDGTGSGVASSVLTLESATLAGGACGSFGSATTITGTDLSAIPFASGNCYRFTLAGSDRVGNVTTLVTTLMVDTTAPSRPSVAFSGLSTGNTFDDGSGTLYYRPSAGGTFMVSASGATDAESAVKSGNAGYGFSPFTGFAGASQAGSSVDVTFNGSSTGSGAHTVHATNIAGLDSTDAGFNVTLDATTPVNGALSVNGTGATGGGTSSYLTSGSIVAIDSRTDYTDAASGIATSDLTVRSAALANDTCGSFGSPATIATATHGVSTGNCYLFTLTGTDRVGNAASLSTTVKVDTTAPVEPTTAFSGLSAGNTYVSGTTLYYRPSAGGTFTVGATGASDPETGIKAGNEGYTFSTLTGFVSATQAGNKVDVAFDGSSAGGGAETVAAVNSAGVASTPATTFTITGDSGAPTGGLLSINPYSSALTVSIATTPFTDALSGIAGNAVTRSNAQAPNGSGGCPNSGYTGATAVAGASDTVPADGQCFEYTLTGTDNVGNIATYRTIVLVDTTGPTGGSVSYVDDVASLGSISVEWNPGTDMESGIGVVTVERATATLTGNNCGPFGSFGLLVANAAASPIIDSAVTAGNCYAYRIVVANNAGLTSTFSSAAVAKLTNASPIQLSSGNPAGVYQSGTTIFLGPGAAHRSFMLELTTTGQNGVTTATWQGKATGPLTSAPAADTVGDHSGGYTWDGTTPLSDTIQLTRDPGATVDTVNVVSDVTSPTGSITYADGNNPSHSVAISTSSSDTGGSGVAGVANDPKVMRAETTLTGSNCDTGAPSWTSFAPVTLVAGNDTTVTDNHCYRYQLLVTDYVGNEYTATSANVAKIPDIMAPTFGTAATNVAGTQLSITMSEPVDTTATTPPGAFTVFYDGVAQPTPTGITVSGATIALDLVSPPDNSETVTVRYSQPGSGGDRMRDDASPTKNETASFGPSPVVRNTPDTVAPSVVSASVDAGTLTITFDETLGGAAPDASAFTVTTGGTARSVSTVGMSGKTVTLAISPTVTRSDDVVVAYAVPALNALHDPTGNNTAPFTIGTANETPIITLPAGDSEPSPPAPALVSASPEDGSTVRAVSSITLSANQSVSWRGMTVTGAGGSVTRLPDDAGQSWTWPFAPAAEGLYTIRGTITGGGRSEDVLSHFTVWTPQSDGAIPPVQKNAVPFAAGQLKSSDGRTVLSWPAGVFSDSVVVEVAPKPLSEVQALPASSIVVSVTAFKRSTHQPVTQLDGVVDILFPNATPGAYAVSSPTGSSWSDVPELPTLNLPADQNDGWFRDSDGTVHVLARHLTFFALVGQEVSTKLAMRIITVRRLWLENRSFIAVRMSLTAPARVTGSFVAPDGSIVPGQTIKTPTRHAGVTLLRVPLHVTTPGIYRLQMHADGVGQVVNRTARIRFVATRPATPVWTDLRPLRVAVIHGVKGMGSLHAKLGRGFVVRPVADAALYDVLDTGFRTAAMAVVVDLDTVPTRTLVSLHALLPEVRILGFSDDRAHAARYRRIGVSALLPRSTSPAAVSSMIKSLLRGR
jgi:hypothetical protein